MRFRDDAGAMTTLTAILTVIALVGVSMVAFNEYERTTLRQQAMEQTTSIIVGDYEYTFGNMTKVPNMPSGTVYSPYNFDLNGDKVVWAHTYNHVFSLKGYNLTSETHFTIRTASGTENIISWANLGDGVVAWCEDIDTNINTYLYCVRAFYFNNGTTWTSPQQSAVHQYSTAVVGKYVIYAQMWNNTDSIAVYRFDTMAWTTSKIKEIECQAGDLLYLEADGVEDEIVYFVEGGGYYRLNVESLQTTPLITGGANYMRNRHGIYDDVCGVVDYSNNKFKSIDFKKGTSKILDNATANYATSEAISCWGDNFFAYYYHDEGYAQFRFYDTDTDIRIAINNAYPLQSSTYTCADMSERYVIHSFGSTLYYYEYERTNYKEQDNATGDGNETGGANRTAIPDTTLGKAKSWLTDNWILVAGAGVVAGGLIIFGYRKFASSPKYREIGAKRNINWGLVVAIAIISLISIIFML
jgi:hypothetical protein